MGGGGEGLTVRLAFKFTPANLDPCFYVDNF